MKNSLFIMSLFSLLFSITVKANQFSQPHFMSKGEEVSLYYTGDYDNPDTVTFDFKCEPSQCDLNARAEEVAKDFIRAVQRNKIYLYRLVVDCPPGTSCGHIDRKPTAYDGSQHSPNGPESASVSRVIRMLRILKGFGGAAVKGAGQQAGSDSMDAIFDQFTDDKDSGMVELPRFSVIINDSKPLGLCEIKKISCREVPEVVVADINGGIVVGMTVDPVTSSRFSNIQNSLQQYVIGYAEGRELQCQTIVEGLNGRLKWGVTCSNRS